ncbi:hypothetical protein EGW08_015930 [Elysia chlorotica]|uniref:Arf-GAP domain-containing protein n=1 Tax=Elysia chlorotica TaxID=188477 RepID=A0A433T461_ELYCH|nr:hypothetical protein EGW08_015930 [Elysia chlorotica]
MLSRDIRKVKDTKKLFEKISDDMDSALVRNSQTQRSKTQECEDANNALTAMRSCFAHTSLDSPPFNPRPAHFLHHIKDLTERNVSEAGQERMLSFMHAQNTFFHQGHDLFQDLESTYMKDIAGQVEELSGKAKVEMKEMEERHTLVQQKVGQSPRMHNDLSISSILQGNGNILNTEGYLFKRNSNAFKNYARRWFSITEGQLVYRKRSKDNLTVMEEDLRLCTIRPQPDLDRRFCFEKQTLPLTHSLTPLYPLPLVTSRMEQLLAIPGNSRCCDCGEAEPRWASINLGCTLCIECSGIHRSFGVHMSKVRSITLDTWEPEQLKVMLELGNAVVNGIYEGAVDESIAVRAKPDSNRSVRENWIRSKYVDKAFVKKLPGVTRANKLSKWSVRKKSRRSAASQRARNSAGSALCKTTSLPEHLPSSRPAGGGNSPSEKISPGSKGSGGDDSVLSGSGSAEEEDEMTTSWEDMSRLDPHLLLYKACGARNLPVMLQALANRADPNWVNLDDGGRTPIMRAVVTGSMATCEFLLLNNAKLDRKDRHGQTPLHHATILGHTGQVCQLLKRRADLNAKDNQQRTPLMIAVDNANADIVTLLRLAKFDEEMKESDGYLANPADDTFQDVFRDFTNMASNNPEKLKRK